MGSPFFPGQAGSDDVSIECPGLTNPDWRFMRAIHNGIRFEGSRGFHERFRLIPHGTDGWFYIWSRSEQKYICMDKDHERGQATLVTHKKPDGGLFRIQKGTYDCAPYFSVKPPPMGEVTRTERVKRMNDMQVEWTTTSTTQGASTSTRTELPTTTTEILPVTSTATTPQKVTTTFLSTTKKGTGSANSTLTIGVTAVIGLFLVLSALALYRYRARTQ